MQLHMHRLTILFMSLLLIFLLPGCLSTAVSQPVPTRGTDQPGQTTLPLDHAHGEDHEQAGNPSDGSTPPAPDTGGNQPTPSKPTIDFQPRGGVAGTQVNVRGWGFPANEHVVLRIGLPEAVGEALNSARANTAGEWSMQVIIPGTVPSGEQITTPDMRLVAMDEENVARASAAFAFEPGNPPMESAPVYGFASTPEEAVKYLLDAILNYPDSQVALAYTSNDLFHQYEQGPVINMLQLQNPFRSYTLDGVVGNEGDRPIVQVTLDSGTRKQFITATDQPGGGVWLVTEIRHLPLTDPTTNPTTAPMPGNHSPEAIAAAEQIVRTYYEAMGRDRAEEAWTLQTTALQAVITVESLANSGGDVVSSEVVDTVVTGSTDDSMTIRATVDLVLEPDAPGSLGEGGQRDFSVTLVASPGQSWQIRAIMPL